LRDYQPSGEKTIVTCSSVSAANPGLARWREHSFSFASKLAQQPATYFQMPVGRAIELSQQVEI
jgi:K+ transporter